MVVGIVNTGLSHDTLLQWGMGNTINGRSLVSYLALLPCRPMVLITELFLDYYYYFA